MSRTGVVRLAALVSCLVMAGCAKPNAASEVPASDEALTRAAVACYQIGQLDQAVRQWKAEGTPIQDPGIFAAIAQNAAGISQGDQVSGSMANLERSTAAMKFRVERGEDSWIIDLVDAEKACIELGLMADG